MPPQRDVAGPGGRAPALVEGGLGQVRDVVVVAASAGGLEAFGGLVAAIDPAIPAGIALVYHRHPRIEGEVLAILRRQSPLPVVEPAAGDPFVHGYVFVAPRDRHLLLDRRGAFVLSTGPPVHHSRPAADALFASAAAAFGPRVLGVVLSGAGLDGARGCQAIKAAGGVVLVQDLDEADFPFMPRHTIDRDHVDAVLPLPGLAGAVQALAAGASLPGLPGASRVR